MHMFITPAAPSMRIPCNDTSPKRCCLHAGLPGFQRKFIYIINTWRIKLSHFAMKIQMKLNFEDCSSFSMFWSCFLQSFQSHHRCPRIPDFHLRQRSASHQWKSFAFLIRWSSNDYTNHTKQHLSKNLNFFCRETFTSTWRKVNNIQLILSANWST